MGNRPPQLDDLISLNLEIAALVKAGVPIELGLRGLSGSRETRFEQLTERLADRLSSGRSLSQAIEEEGPSISPIYASVIEAGLASGRLPEALESLAASGQILQETGRRVTLAMIYPLICVAIAYGLLCQWIVFVVPRLLSVLDLIQNQWPVDLLRFVERHQDYITFVIPSAVTAVVLVLFLLRHGLTRRLWRSLTSFHWVLGRCLEWTQFTELLALQVEQQCPLPHALVLAANSTTDRRLQQQAKEISERLKGGMSLAEALQSKTLFPPLMRWMLVCGEKQGTLGSTLRQLSETYRRRALYRAVIVKVWLPVLLTIGFTGFIGLSYGLGFVLPLRAFLEGLTQE